MKTRLGIFIAALLLLPLAGFLLSGGLWSELHISSSASGEAMMAVLRSTLLLALYLLLVNILVKRHTGNSPLASQRPYFTGISIASVVLAWLLCYLNLFVTSAPQSNIPLILLATPLFALLAPAILVTRAWLACFPGLLKFLTFRNTLPVTGGETQARILLACALLGLSGGAAWPEQLNWLLWGAPLLLLISMQLFWHESTIFARVKSGDWGRVACTALSGILVGNLAVLSYQTTATIHLPNQLTQAGFVLFGLTCLQLSDVVAENWRGKSRAALFSEKKKFPIPVIVKKS